jgi:predicted nucleotidyltransferase
MYQANRAAPIYDELRRIVVKTVGAADPVRQALRALDDRIARAAIYGSVAKGSDVAGSDIDLLVVSDMVTLEDLYRALDPAERVLGRRISPTLVGTAEFDRKQRARDTFLQRVMAGPLIALVGDTQRTAN